MTDEPGSFSVVCAHALSSRLFIITAKDYTLTPDTEHNLICSSDMKSLIIWVRCITVKEDESL